MSAENQRATFLISEGSQPLLVSAALMVAPGQNLQDANAGGDGFNPDLNGQEHGLRTWAHFCGCINTLHDGPAWIRWLMICHGDYHSFCNFTSIQRVRLKGVALPAP